MKHSPKISVVTPSFNQARFLEQTIRSVLDQHYPNLEYIVMDGGSTDQSVEIIRKHERHLAHWVSEKDNGQADAIYRGFERSTGEILAWINSDDYYLPHAFEAILSVFHKHRDAELVIGGYVTVDENSAVLQKHPSFVQDHESLLVWGQRTPQMGSFWLRKAFFDVGGFDRSLKFAFDYDLLLRLTKRRNPLRCNAYLAAFRSHDDSKSSTIWETVGLPEVETLQRLHGVQGYGPAERSRIRRRSELQYATIQLRLLENIARRPLDYGRAVIQVLKCLARSIPWLMYVRSLLVRRK